MSAILSLLTAALILCGSAFALLASIGINRLPDLFTRMHAASKAGTVGSGLLLVAAGLHAEDLSILVRSLAGFLFFVLTAPISAHLVAKTAHQVGYKLDATSVVDEMQNESGIRPD